AAPGGRGALRRAAAGAGVADQPPTRHASAGLAGARAVLIRGPAGSGKSQLALALIQAAETGLLRFARLVGDDRVHLEARHGRLIVRPAAALAGLIEVRGAGIRRLDHEPMAVVGLVVDLAAEDAGRLPAAGEAGLLGVAVRRVGVGPRAGAAARPSSPSCVHRRVTLNLDHDPCSRAQWHKSNRRTLSSRSARRWEGAPLPQCNTVSKSPERPLRLGFGWS